MNEAKTAEEHYHNIMVLSGTRPREYVKKIVAEARREAWREAEASVSSNSSDAVEYAGFDSGLRIAGTFIAKAIEQLGDSDHE